MTEYMLTTFDNPYSPFYQYDEWYRFDEDKGYHTCSYLGRIARISDELSDAENNEEIERAIDQIIFVDPFNIYKKVKKEKSVPNHI